MHPANRTVASNFKSQSFALVHFSELQKHAPRTMLGIVASRGSARQPTSYNHEHAKKILRIIGATRPSLARRATGFTKSHPVIHTRFL
jgi:hypothetical protein